jgi:hypothetical protein
MKGKLIWSIFWALVVVVAIVVSGMFIVFNVFNASLEGFIHRVVQIGLVTIVGLGVTLIVLTVKTKVGGILKKFSLLTGASAVGLPYSLFLLILYLVEPETVFLLVAMVCPIGFLVGVVSTIVLAAKNKPLT